MGIGKNCPSDKYTQMLNIIYILIKHNRCQLHNVRFCVQKPIPHVTHLLYINTVLEVTQY